METQMTNQQRFIGLGGHTGPPLQNPLCRFFITPVGAALCGRPLDLRD
jgi:hypothetical protein